MDVDDFGFDTFITAGDNRYYHLVGLAFGHAT
jgi:hypothetical protein